MEYYLEVYEPDESGAVAASYQSSSPFMALTIGEAIHGGCLNFSSINKTVRIKDIQHIIWEIEGSHTAHQLCIYTEPLK